MKRPHICFLGDENLCRGFIDAYKKSVRAFYIRKTHKRKNRFLSVPPTFFCIILEKGKSARSGYLSEAISYAEKNRCPVYVVCSPDQYDGIRNLSEDCDLEKVTLLALHKLIKKEIQHYKESSSGDEDFIRERFASVSVMTLDPALAALCESELSFNSINQRVMINVENKETENFNGYLITETPDGDVPSDIRQIAGSLSEKVPAVYIGTKDKVRIPKRITYISINSGSDSIKAHFKKYHKKKLKLISYEK